MKKMSSLMGLLACIALLAGCSTMGSKKSADPGDIISNSVSITNNDSNSGGSGTVIKSSDEASYVLTNSHVCEVAEEGGLVHGVAGTFAVAGLKHSKEHDLCLIKVMGNLQASTRLAKSGAEPYRAEASISGHPSLYPTIMPGSSGSGVFNKDNELTGVAFAGSGELGYAWTVPYEYVRNFLLVESKKMKFKIPSNKVNLFGKRQQRKRIDTAKQVCKTPKRVSVKNACKVIEQDMIY